MSKIRSRGRENLEMSGNKGIYDSNVIILFSKGKIDIEMLSLKYDQVYASIIIFIEVYAFDFEDKDEKALVDLFFRNVEIVEVNNEIADQTIRYRKNKAKKIKLRDAIILASAKVVGADLVTDNFSDFHNVDSSVNLLNLDDFKVKGHML